MCTGIQILKSSVRENTVNGEIYTNGGQFVLTETLSNLTAGAELQLRMGCSCAFVTRFRPPHNSANFCNDDNASKWENAKFDLSPPCKNV